MTNAAFTNESIAFRSAACGNGSRVEMYADVGRSSADTRIGNIQAPAFLRRRRFPDRKLSTEIENHRAKIFFPRNPDRPIQRFPFAKSAHINEYLFLLRHLLIGAKR